ncbi:MAG: SprT family zinc-dependent metalloprotease [Polaromonas sp.]
MTARIALGDIAVEVVFKDIKNIHLSVYPPDGAVRVSAPLRMQLDTIRVFAISRLAWIKQQQARLRAQQRETPREYIDRESHYVWDKRYLLKVVEADAAPTIELKHSRIMLRVRPGTDEAARQAIVAHWYREQIRATVPALIAKWETAMGVKVGRVFVQKMKTKWGSCNPAARSIRLNTDLAKKPLQCLEYIVLHELAHLIERHHNERFTGLMNRHMPDWPQRRQLLNGAPLGHEDWGY